MVIFLYGQDTYRSKQRLDVLKKEFIKRKDEKGLNINVFEADNLSIDELRKSFLSAGLFSEKRLVILRGILNEKILKNEKNKETLFEEIIKIIKENKKNQTKTRTDNIIIFWDEEVNEKKLNSFQKKIFFLLKKEKFCEEFKPLTIGEVKKWIKKQINNQGFKINEQALGLLINTFSNDLWLINNELNKLTAYLAGQKKDIVFSDVQKIILPSLEQDIWKLVDCLGQKNKSRALKILSDQFKQNVDVSQIITLLAHQYRTLIRIKSYLGKNQINNPYQLAKILSLHPFVCRKAMAQEKNHNLEQLKKTYQQLLKIDLWRKTKNINPETLLDLLIVRS